MFLTAAGNAWGASMQIRPQREACQRANIKPAFGFHILRHAYGAQCVTAGMPLQVLAENLGHADTRMSERHYAHLTKGSVREQVTRFAPSFGIEPMANAVVPSPKT